MSDTLMSLRHIDFNRREHGFVGHLAEPEQTNGKAVIVIMGGEQSLLPGIKIAERFADYGFLGLAVSLFGAEGLPDSPDRCPLEMFESAVHYLKAERNITHISTYGQSMGSIFAVLAAQYIGSIENVIMVSPTHVPFEGTAKDKKHMSGHSVAIWRNKEIPFVRADFSKIKTSKYYKTDIVPHKVLGMWLAYYEAYQDKTAEEKAHLELEKTDARILLIAGGAGEAWPAEYSVSYIEQYLRKKNYGKEYKSIIYPDVSHLTGMMPNKERERKLYRMIPLIGIMYKSFGKHKKECMAAFEQSEKEIIDWLR